MDFARRLRRLAGRARKRYAWLSACFRRLSVLALGVYAANASFFLLLSVFPATMLLIGLLPYTALSADDLRSSLAGLLPKALLPLLDYVTGELFSSNSPALLSVSALTALWSASRGAYSVLRGLNRVFGLREERSYLRLRLRCALFTLLLLPGLLLSAALQLFGRQLAERLDAASLPPLQLLAGLLELRLPLMVLLLGLLMALVYTVLPNHRVRFRKMLPGAGSAAIGWQLFSGVFSYYVNRFGSYSLYYGSLAVIAMTMLWLYICMWILLLGAAVNRSIAARLPR